MDILEQLKQITQTGTEDQVRDFIAEHFNELPPHLQKEYAMELFKEALEQETAERKALVDLKQEAVDVIDRLEQ